MIGGPGGETREAGGCGFVGPPEALCAREKVLPGLDIDLHLQHNQNPFLWN